MTDLTKTALILGATGGIGGEAAAALIRHGWRVRALTRRPQTPMAGLDWIVGDAMNPADVAAAAAGAGLIVHAVNPPGYKDWDKLVLPMLDNSIAAAKAQGARIVLPGTLYNFGMDALPVINARSPQTPSSRKGAIRAEMERRLEAAARDGARVLIVRAGDFFGPRAANTWFSQVVKAGSPVTVVNEPQRRGATHAWAYLPDLGETMALLAEREADLAPFEVFQFEGFQLAYGEMTQAIRRVTGNPGLRLRAFPWAVVIALSPAVRLFRELVEVRMVWMQTIQLDGERLRGFLGEDLPKTTLEDAVRATLKGMGCIDSAGR